MTSIDPEPTKTILGPGDECFCGQGVRKWRGSSLLQLYSVGKLNQVHQEPIGTPERTRTIKAIKYPRSAEFRPLTHQVNTSSRQVAPYLCVSDEGHGGTRIDVVLYRHIAPWIMLSIVIQCQIRSVSEVPRYLGR